MTSQRRQRVDRPPTEFNSATCPCCGRAQGYTRVPEGLPKREQTLVSAWDVLMANRDPQKAFGVVFGSSGRRHRQTVDEKLGTIEVLRELEPADDTVLFEGVKQNLLTAVTEYRAKGWLTDQEITDALGGFAGFTLPPAPPRPQPPPDVDLTHQRRPLAPPAPVEPLAPGPLQERWRQTVERLQALDQEGVRAELLLDQFLAAAGRNRVQLGLGDVFDALDDFRSITRTPYPSMNAYAAARRDLWDIFVASLDAADVPPARLST